MENGSENISIIPEKFKVLSGSVLKTLALVFMIMDHVAHYLPDLFAAVVYTLPSGPRTVYRIMRNIGRISFPIYAFLLVEGFIHTKDRKKYGLRLLIFAVISEFPWDLVHVHKLVNLSSQNVFFTLFLGFAGMYLFELFQNDRIRQAVSLLILLVISVFLKADYGITGFCFIMMMYALRERRLLKTVVGCGFLSSTWHAGLAFIPINLYNGKRGFIKGKALQYAYYAIYPLHLFVLYLITK